MLRRLLDWWRDPGFDDRDIASLKAKLAEHPARPGAVTHLSGREVRAFHAHLDGAGRDGKLWHLLRVGP